MFNVQLLLTVDHNYHPFKNCRKEKNRTRLSKQDRRRCVKIL